MQPSTDGDPQGADPTARGRVITRRRIIDAAVDLADADGLDAVTVRRLARQLEVTPMALYYHVRDKVELVDALVDRVFSTINAAVAAESRARDWKARLRGRVLLAHREIGRHPWADRLIADRAPVTTAQLEYLDASVAELWAAGLSARDVHYAVHALGPRLYGAGGGSLDLAPRDTSAALEAFPHLGRLVQAIARDADAADAATWCDEQDEFEFGLDVILDAIERAHAAAEESVA